MSRADDSDVARRLATYAVVLAMIAVGLVLSLDVAYFAHGSLEEFPTDEQQSKVRVVTAVLAALLIVAEAVLFSVFHYLKRAAPHERAADEIAPPSA